MTHDNGPWARPPAAPAPPAPRVRPRILLWLAFCAALAAIILALARAFPEAVRTPADWAEVARAAGILVLVAAGMFRAGRVLRPQHLKYAAAWAGIIAVLALGFAYRRELSDVGQHLQLAFSAGDPVVTAERELVVPQGEDGGYILVGRVNGQRVRFVVDTGATDTVLSPDDARRIGVDMASLRYVMEAETANGMGSAAPYVAQRLEVGPMALSDFQLTVNRAPMSASLLGMSFLSRLESFHIEDHKLVLRWREAG
ncbi:TIGR02281 family clan AA aspartic protease [Phenylobacterium sp. LjRoot225]|uniref:retropepsin-like aspartic protease family protein n=1 Tax=Phenylobacterium sp. LjRoot225 TaxID=3342285 RepID=UPI003ED0B474